MAKPAVQTFGKYQILERIATGGMAEIYKARLEGIGGFSRTFAIKRILPHLSQNAEYVAMLVDEAKVAGLLSHANIVQILDLGQVDGVWYIAMEYVEGKDLGGVVRKASDKGLCLPVPHTVFVTIELLKGLEYAHQRQVMRGGRPVPLNIIHRDISPPNILISYQGEVKLTDFGIARASHKALETQSGIIKGRFDYMSPEQAAGAKDLDQRSDLFSVGVVLYEMLTGEHPFRAESELGTLDRIRAGRYAPISTQNPDVPFTLETIVDRALRVDRTERYPSATAFKEALDKFFHESGFIFTHSTLAAYMRGLFPEPGKGRAGPSLPPAPLVDEETFRDTGGGKGRSVDVGADTDDLDLEFDGDGPTRIMDDPRRRAATPPPADDRPTNVSFDGPPIVPPIAADEQATLLRPALSAADFAAAEQAPQWTDEQETQIRPSPFTPAPATQRADSPGPATVRAEVPRFPEAPPASEVPTPRKPERAEPERRSRGVGVLTFVIAAMALGVGLLLGAGVGVVGLQLIAGGPGGASARAEPVLRIQAPTGAVVKVNDVPVTGEIAVEAERPQRVQVTMQGRAPWEHTITLLPGELRVIVVDAATLEPETP